MARLFFFAFFIYKSLAAYSQQYSMSLGVHTGLTVPYMWDKGINDDPRYRSRYTVKSAPIGVTYSMDYEGFGLLLTPGLVNVGQDFYVVNTSGGQEGKRTIDLQYLNIPVAFKLHLINLDFFRVSAVASVSAAFLLEGEEVIRHNDAKLYFPEAVHPILPPAYTVEYDGVLSPNVSDYRILSKSDFNSLQYFVAAGLRSDWDVSNSWRVSFDLRVNYGLTEPRSNEYLSHVRNHETLYDTYGERRDLFVQLSAGIARYIDFDKNDRSRQKKLKGNKRKFTPKGGPRRAKPRG